MSEKSIVSVRIDNEHIELLAALADIDNSTLANEIRTAIEKYISLRANDKELGARIAEIKKKRDSRLRKLLDRS